MNFDFFYRLTLDQLDTLDFDDLPNILLFPFEPRALQADVYAFGICSHDVFVFSN